MVLDVSSSSRKMTIFRAHPLSNKMAHYKCPNKLEDVSKKNVNNIAIKDSGCMVVDQFQSAE